MAASRALALRGVSSGRFWLSAFCVALMPTSIGYQDVAALLGRQPAVVSAPAHMIASPFGTIEPATFSYGVRPIGTAMPDPPAIALASFDPSSLDANAWSIGEPLREEDAPPVVYPTVNRKHKGDREPITNSAPAAPAPQSLNQLMPISALPAGPAVSQLDAEVPASGEIGAPTDESAPLATLAFADTDAGTITGSVGLPAGLRGWAPGAAPVMATPSMTVEGLTAPAVEGEDSEIAGKDESRAQSPAQRLGLAGKPRAKAVKCLTEAVYFEARGEPLRGQQAVAQVVMNRVFSGYYPNDVCGVVFQNAGHYLGCQFTFACEHKDLSRIEEPDMWEQATRIANDTLDGKIWLADIGHATHYHAYWVHPSWVHEMTRLYKLGVHTFYRPRAWGNGDYEPVWGAPPDTSQDESKPDTAVKGPQAEATPVAGKSNQTARS
jgi:spore germination cell wall hydrolase CwlJ-like protein